MQPKINVEWKWNASKEVKKKIVDIEAAAVANYRKSIPSSAGNRFKKMLRKGQNIDH